MRFSHSLAPLLIATLFSAFLAISPATALTYDSDGDGIPDSLELNGYDADQDGVIDIDFPAFGADPYKKDIFVEMDYMPGELASKEELDIIVKTFAELPVRNSNGTTGINLHLDAGPVYSDYDLGGGNEIPYK